MASSLLGPATGPSGPRFTEYTPTNHQAPLWVATSVSLTYVGLVFLVRMVIKYTLWSWDDLVLGIAHVFAAAQWGLIYAALEKGAGKVETSLNSSSIADAADLVFVSRLLMLITLGFSKCCVLLFLRQLFPRDDRRPWKLCTALLAVSACWTVASALAVSIGCSSRNALDPERNSACPGDLARWKAVIGFDVVVEVALMVLPIYLFAYVQMSTKRKLIVAGAFGFRIGVPALLIAYLESYINFRQGGRASLDAASFLTLQQILLGYSLISATTPCIKGFLERFRTDYFADVSGYAEGSQKRSKARSYAMTNLDNKGVKATSSQDPIVPDFSPGDIQYSARAHANGSADKDELSVGHSVRGPAGIYRRVEWEVLPS